MEVKNQPSLIDSILLPMLSEASNRSQDFWKAWTIVEHGWDYASTVLGLNLTNISSDGSLSEAWFYGVTKINPNGTVDYPNPAVAMFDTLLFIQQAWPEILTAGDDEAACMVLNGSGKFGVWATGSPGAYGTKIWEVVQELEAKKVAAIPPTVVSDTKVENGITLYPYVVRSGDTLSRIATLCKLGGGGYKYLQQVNDLKNPNLIRVGDTIWVTKHLV